MELKVRKRDGSLQDFDRNKIADSIAKAGGAPEQAEEITTQVENWASVAAGGGVIGSLEIRSKVIELLRAVNPEAAKVFEEYRKPS